MTHEDGDPFTSPLHALATAIQTLAKEEGIGKCPLLISLGRKETEWLQQKLPPSNDSEIPLLLKNQVLREIAGSTEADPIDYLILESSSEGHRILTLTMAQSFRKTLLKTFRSLGYPPAHLGFRAGNAAELVLQHTELLEGEHDAPRLVVNTAGNDVDLIIIADKRITAVRSFRLPTEHRQKSLADEMERTLTIGMEGNNPQPIRHIVLFGNETTTDWQSYFAQSELTVQVLNPFTLPSVSVSGTVEEPEKFAPLIGSLLIQARKIKPVIDFLHPKEAPKPPNYTRPILLALILLGIVGAGLYHWNRGVINGMEKELAAIKAEHAKVAAGLQQVMPSYYVLAQTRGWESQNVVWLDTMKELSDFLPDHSDLVIVQMTLTTSNDRRYSGSIALSGMVRDPLVLGDFQNALRSSGRYLMQPPVQRPNPAGGGYPFLFTATVYRVR